MRNCEEWLQTACKDFDPKAIEWRYNQFKEKFIKPMDKWLTDQGLYGRVMNQQGRWKIKELLENIAGLPQDIDDWIPEMFAWAEWKTDRDTHQAMESLIHNLNSLACRAGSQVPFSSVNTGLDTTPEGRMVTKNLFLSQEEGLGNGETPIFPITIMKLKKGITDPGSPNYDLFQLSCRVSAHRLLPNWVNMDAPFNLQYYRSDRPETHVATMGMTDSGIVDIKINNKQQAVNINRLDEVLQKNKACTEYKRFDKHTTYVELTKRIEVRDTMSPTGWTVVKKWMKCDDPAQKWVSITDAKGDIHHFTSDHPLPVKAQHSSWERTEVQHISNQDILAGVSADKSSVCDLGIQTIVPIDKQNQPIVGYDIETESDRFTLDSIISHNCLSKNSKLILKDPNGAILFVTADYFRNLGEGISYLEDYQIYTGEKFVKLINVALRKETDHILRIESSHGYIEVTGEQKIPIIRNREEMTVPASEVKPMDVLFWKSSKEALPPEYQLTHINLIDLIHDAGLAKEYGVLLTNDVLAAFMLTATDTEDRLIERFMGADVIDIDFYLKFRVALSQYLDERKVYIGKIGKKSSIPAVYELTADFGRFFGLFYSEGSVNSNSSIIPVTNKDMRIIDFVTDFVSRTWSESTFKSRNKNDCILVYLRNSSLGSLFLNGVLGIHGGSANLQLPKWFWYANEEFLKGFLGGVIDGDGSVVPQNYTRIITASQQFAYDLQSLITRLGYRASVSMEHSKGTVAHFGNVQSIRRFDTWRVTLDNMDIKALNLTTSLKCRKLDDFEKVKTKMANTPRDYSNRVRSITQIPYNDYVYDFETEDHFIYDNTIWHNQCRTRVISNIHQPNKEISVGRGNLFMLNLSLPYLALELKEEEPTLTGQALIDAYFDKVKYYMEEAFDSLLDRFEIIARRKVYNFPFLMGQGLYLDSEKLGPDDEIREVIKNGTLTVGFIGLSEALVALTGKHHGESPDSQKLGLKIVGFMCDMCKAKALETKLNFSLMGSPAEGAAGRLLRCARKRFGVVEGVTDKEWFTNSHHVDVRYPISAWDKINIEAPYHALEPAG